ncbi:MAG: hypothetical protein M3Z26_16235 [Bacteroidota bacterium]|nr:hypothetical protein [Bacteroidota bacterium]
MMKIKSIQLKTAILLVVFSLNTIIGFACSVGLDMGFNSHHHEEEVTEAAVHMHADGKKLLHSNEATNHHDKKVKSHHNTGDKDNCCNDEVTKIAQQDKAIAPSMSIISPVFFTALVSSFYNVDTLLSNGADSHIKYLARRHHPPIPDIRLAIQSFQI